MSDAKRFRGGLVFKAHRLVYYSTLGLRVINKKKTTMPRSELPAETRKPLQGYLAHKKQPPPLGLPQGPRHWATVGFNGGGVLMSEVPLYESSE